MSDRARRRVTIGAVALVLVMGAAGVWSVVRPRSTSDRIALWLDDVDNCNSVTHQRSKPDPAVPPGAVLPALTRGATRIEFIQCKTLRNSLGDATLWTFASHAALLRAVHAAGPRSPALCLLDHQALIATAASAPIGPGLRDLCVRVGGHVSGGAS